MTCLPATRIRTLDAHAGGAPLRLIVEGLPPLRGRTLDEKEAWIGRQVDAIRLALVREPRGHADMTLALLTEPADPQALAGLLFLGPEHPAPFYGHGVIAAVTIALERQLLVPGHEGPFVLETTAGLVEVRAAREVEDPGDGHPRVRVREVAYRPPPVFVARPSLLVTVERREVHVDVVWASGWYVLVDREALGIPPEAGALDVLRRGVRRLLDVLAPRVREWPTPAGARSLLAGVVLTGPPGRADADLRSITVYADGTIDRSPSGAATAAVVAVLDAMGVLRQDAPFHHEGPSGLTFRARTVQRLHVGEVPAIRVEIVGEAWLTGEHVFVLDPRDPLPTGFAL